MAWDRAGEAHPLLCNDGTGPRDGRHWVAMSQEPITVTKDIVSESQGCEIIKLLTDAFECSTYST
jgi:hypothetical protein